MNAQEKLEWVGKHISSIDSHLVGRELRYNIEYFDSSGFDCEANGDSFEEALENAIGGQNVQ